MNSFELFSLRPLYEYNYFHKITLLILLKFENIFYKIDFMHLDETIKFSRINEQRVDVVQFDSKDKKYNE